MKLFLTLAIVSLFFNVQAQNDYRKAWNKDSLLTWADFKGPIDESSDLKPIHVTE
ncbi:hypothetical protein [Mucilaginibacter pallidiroseus]|uniref:hypothetical protein n=1 Tax=Mucilaginibacter pallidiroseus TaxID=2599295 RepID=UPI00164625C8|nr:hypothetical protein [Mucilaginibacter pallidiroseus]